MRSLRARLLGIPASMALHAIGFLALMAMFRSEPAPAVLEILLLEPVVESEPSQRSGLLNERMSGSEILRRTAASRETPTPLSAPPHNSKRAQSEEVEAASLSERAAPEPPLNREPGLQSLPFSSETPPTSVRDQVFPQAPFGSLEAASSAEGKQIGALAMLPASQSGKTHFDTPGRLGAVDASAAGSESKREGGALSPGGAGQSRELSIGTEQGKGSATTSPADQGMGTTSLALPSDGTRHLQEYDRFYALIRDQIQGALHYPAAAVRRGLNGTVLVEIVLHTDGRVERVEVLRSSAHRVLDEAAIGSVKRAAPYSFLSALPARQITVRLPIVFELK